ncbi:epoxide hydrolase N terminus-domain-containing protein [Mycena vitilis]|nr:epoxide hydrolase N terminus-domain-containing protein [Mycena vitilis]
MAHSLLSSLTACLVFAIAFTPIAATSAIDNKFNVRPFENIHCMNVGKPTEIPPLMMKDCADTVTTETFAFGEQAPPINLAAEIPRLKTLVHAARLPSQALYPSFGSEKGVELDVLSELRTEWLTKYDWEAQQAELNQFNHFTAVIEEVKIHFVHEKSTDPDAIPVILLHGWPGNFLCPDSR